MLRLLRWVTFLVLIAVVVGALLSYPLLRDRFFAPMLAAPASDIEVIPNADVAALPAVVAQATITTQETATVQEAVTVQPTNTNTPTTRPTQMPTRATSPALIIQAPSPSVTTQSSTPQTPTAQSVATPTPVAIVTTSLLPPTATSAPIAPTATPTATTIVTASVGIAVPVTPSTPTPTVEAGQAAAVGEKGYEAPIANTSVASEATPTPILVIVTAGAPVITTPIVVTTVEVSPVFSTSNITPMVVIPIELTPQAGTPITPLLPLGPVANMNGPLYSGPDLNAAIVGEVAIGDSLLIIGIYTEGTWYLLANGLWLPGSMVDNAPMTLPLVFPTITPIPTNTPTITPTPIPTATLVGSATPSPTPTSLEAPVCDCSGDHLDCLGNIFANRAAAQSCFEYCFRQTGLDIHLLDPNLNGVACENLR